MTTGHWIVKIICEKKDKISIITFGIRSIILLYPKKFSGIGIKDLNDIFFT